MYKESREEGIGSADREVWNRKVQDRQAHMPDWLKNVIPMIIMFIVILILNVMSISITVSVRYARVRKIEPEITSCFEKNLPGQKIKKFENRQRETHCMYCRTGREHRRVLDIRQITDRPCV